MVVVQPGCDIADIESKSVGREAEWCIPIHIWCLCLFVLPGLSSLWTVFFCWKSLKRTLKEWKDVYMSHRRNIWKSRDTKGFPRCSWQTSDQEELRSEGSKDHRRPESSKWQVLNRISKVSVTDFRLGGIQTEKGPETTDVQNDQTSYLLNRFSKGFLTDLRLRGIKTKKGPEATDAQNNQMWLVLNKFSNRFVIDFRIREIKAQQGPEA